MKIFLIELPSKREVEILSETTFLGRTDDNQISIKNSIVSKKHCKIFIKENDCYIEDLSSKNGTYLNGDIIDTETILKNNDMISLGKSGPIFQFKYKATDTDEINSKILGNGTTKHLFEKKIKKKIIINNKIILSFVIVFLFIMLSLVLGFNILINKGKNRQNLESIQYFENQYKINLTFKEDLSYDIKEVDGKLVSVKQLFIRLMDKYGEENYPTDDYTINKLNYYINYYKDTVTFKEGLERRTIYLPMIEEIFKKHNIPLDLSYIAFVESFYKPEAYNLNSGARGMWQFMIHSGKEYGLKINKTVDERLDVVKSTEAAAEYINDLLAIFGIRSITIAMASYNAGDGFLRWALKKIKDPIKDRNFWYLYNNKLIPYETREYVFKILALIILTENPNIK